MTPTLVPDESMLDAITDQPDTSEIPVLPNSSTYAPMRNPRARLALRCSGTPYATDCFTCCVSA